MTYVTLGASGLWLGTRAGGGSTARLVKNFFWPQPVAPWRTGNLDLFVHGIGFCFSEIKIHLYTSSELIRHLKWNIHLILKIYAVGEKTGIREGLTRNWFIVSKRATFNVGNFPRSLRSHVLGKILISF